MGPRRLLHSRRPLHCILSTSLGKNAIHDNGAQALAALKDSCALVRVRVHELSLDLNDNAVGGIGAQPVVALKDAPALHIPSLILCCNEVGDTGQKALAVLKCASSLQTEVWS